MHPRNKSVHVVQLVTRGACRKERPAPFDHLNRLLSCGHTWFVGCDYSTLYATAVAAFASTT
jgi:hypothetical protein